MSEPEGDDPEDGEEQDNDSDVDDRAVRVQSY